MVKQDRVSTLQVIPVFIIYSISYVYKASLANDPQEASFTSPIYPEEESIQPCSSTPTQQFPAPHPFSISDNNPQPVTAWETTHREFDSCTSRCTSIFTPARAWTFDLPDCSRKEGLSVPSQRRFWRVSGWWWRKSVRLGFSGRFRITGFWGGDAVEAVAVTWRASAWGCVWGCSWFLCLTWAILLVGCSWVPSDRSLIPFILS